MATQMFRYSCRYRRNGFSTRTYRATVVARDADDARRMVAIRDPEFSHAIDYPKRRGEVVETPRQALDRGEATFSVPRCRFCKRADVIAEGLYTRVHFPDGIALVCDVCREKADEPDDALHFDDGGHDIAIEWAE
jgi:hypothetical protein